MPDEVNFVDIVALSRITPDTYAEKFGGMINSSFFDASNILATLRQKGLVDFTTSFPGQSAVTVTELGKEGHGRCDCRHRCGIRAPGLRQTTQLSNGKRTIQDLSGAINIRPTDLAMHLYKLGQQQYLTYEFRNGLVTITLTEKGFVQARSGMPQTQEEKTAQAAADAQQQAANPMSQEGQQPAQQQSGAAGAQPMGGTGQAATAAAAQQKPPLDINQLEANIKKAKMKRMYYVIAAIGIIVIVAVLAYMMNLIKF